MSILLFAEYDAAGLKSSVAHVLSAAVQLGGPVDVLLAGPDSAAAAAQAAGLAGVARVRTAALSAEDAGRVECLNELLLALSADYSHVVAAAGSLGRSLLPRLAALRDVAPVSGVVGIEAADTFIRPVYAGNALVTVRSAEPLKVLTVQASAFPAAAAGGATAPIEAVAALPASGPVLSTVLRRDFNHSGRPELASAPVVVAGGRGLGSGENFAALLGPLADTLNAAIGASRAAVDAGFAPNDCQVGQTGAIVAPKLYIAAGISGAIQHLAGIKDAGVIVAINRDPDAPIFKVADYGLVGDLFEVLPDLTARLAAAPLAG